MLEAIGDWPLLKGDDWNAGEYKFDMVKIVKHHPSFLRYFYKIFVHENTVIRVCIKGLTVKNSIQGH